MNVILEFSNFGLTRTRRSIKINPLCIMRLLSVVLILFLLMGCQDETDQKVDFRNEYTGWFKFTVVKNVRTLCYDKSSNCIDGWKEINFDTSIFVSNVEVYDTDRLKVKFGKNIIGFDDFGDTISQTIYPVLKNNGTLMWPEYPIGGFNNFEGNYRGRDTLNISIQYGFGMGGYDIYRIKGLRIK